jgi:hypothetical protein
MLRRACSDIMSFQITTCRFSSACICWKGHAPASQYMQVQFCMHLLARSRPCKSVYAGSVLHASAKRSRHCKSVYAGSVLHASAEKVTLLQVSICRFSSACICWRGHAPASQYIQVKFCMHLLRGHATASQYMQVLFCMYLLRRSRTCKSVYAGSVLHASTEKVTPLQVNICRFNSEFICGRGHAPGSQYMQIQILHASAAEVTPLQVSTYRFAFALIWNKWHVRASHCLPPCFCMEVTNISRPCQSNAGWICCALYIYNLFFCIELVVGYWFTHHH